ncbi:hypothetical protein D3C71_1350820 [compost metagenome]
MGGHELARGVGAEPVRQVQHARRQAGLVRHLGQQRGGGGRDFRGLHDHGIAESQRRRDLPCQQQQRQVPGRNHTHHAQRLAVGVVQRLPAVRRVGHVAFHVQRARQFGKGPKVGRAARDVDLAGPTDGLARVADLGLQEIVEPAVDAIGQGQQVIGARRHRQPGPRGQRPLGRRDGAADLVAAGFMDLGDQSPVHRAVFVEGGSAVFVVAVQIVAQLADRHDRGPWLVPINTYTYYIGG